MEKSFLTVAESAEFLGYKKNYMYQLIHKNVIPFHKVGAGNRSVRFKREDLQDYLNGKRVEANLSNI